jgi:hypothetical protein
MIKKVFLCLVIGMFLAVTLAVLAAPAPVYAEKRAVTLTPTLIPTPIPPVKVGSNAPLAIGALVLVVIILFGVGLNFRKKK